MKLATEMHMHRCATWAAFATDKHVQKQSRKSNCWSIALYIYILKSDRASTALQEGICAELADRATLVDHACVSVHSHVPTYMQAKYDYK